MSEGKIVGIDLGTTNSVIAVVSGGVPEIIHNSEGGRTTPSVVSYVAGADGEVLVGEPARRAMVTNPEKTFAHVKREMGTDWRAHVEGRDLTPQEIAARILMKLKRDAEEYLGHPVSRAVITVPAYFNDAQRTATKEAGEIAGFSVERIVNEPTAAALSYGFEKSEEETIAVFDFGGGTFDITILEVSEGLFEVVSTNGDTHLGGKDIDDLVADWLNDSFVRDHNVDLREDKAAWARILEASEKAKMELSTTNKADIALPYLAQGEDNKPLHLQKSLNKAQFEKIADSVLDRLVVPCKEAIKDANLDKKDIDKVILVGGSTRIPRVREIVERLFGQAPQKTVNPDEVVAEGAAIQGGILSNDLDRDIVLVDVTPLTLGIETMGGIRTVMIKRNSSIPTEHTEMFSTAANNQPQVDVHVLQGERDMAVDNTTLGKFSLMGIPPAPRGMPQIEVSFKIDANGILNVSAADKKTGKKQEIKITATTSLSKEEVEKKKAEAEAHAEEDKKRRESAETHNNLDSTIYQVEKVLSENEEKVPEDAKSAVNDALAKAKEALEGDDPKEKKKALENLTEESMKIGQAIYEAEASESAEADDGSVPEGDEIIEGEDTEVPDPDPPVKGDEEG